MEKSRSSGGKRPFHSGLALGFLVLLSVVLGLVFNAMNPRGLEMTGSSPNPDAQGTNEGANGTLETTEFVHDGPLSDSGFPVVDWDQVLQLTQRHDALLVDARPDWSFKAGHIPGAVNLPFSFPVTPAEQQFVRTYAKNRNLIIYCGEPSCDRLEYLATKLRDEAGFTLLWLYKGGYEDYLIRNQ